MQIGEDKRIKCQYRLALFVIEFYFYEQLVSSIHITSLCSIFVPNSVCVKFNKTNNFNLYRKTEQNIHSILLTNQISHCGYFLCCKQNPYTFMLDTYEWLLSVRCFITFEFCISSDKRRQENMKTLQHTQKQSIMLSHTIYVI